MHLLIYLAATVKYKLHMYVSKVLFIDWLTLVTLDIDCDISLHSQKNILVSLSKSSLSPNEDLQYMAEMSASTCNYCETK